MRTCRVLGIILLVVGALVGCGDKAERRESSSTIKDYADRYKDKARAVEDRLKESAEARRKALAAEEGGSSE